MCRLAVGADEVAECLKNQKVMAGLALMLNSPRSHRVLDGFAKGDEATLDVSYTWANMPDSYGVVVVKQQKGKWVLSTFGGSGSTTVVKQAGA